MTNVVRLVGPVEERILQDISRREGDADVLNLVRAGPLRVLQPTSFGRTDKTYGPRYYDACPWPRVVWPTYRERVERREALRKLEDDARWARLVAASASPPPTPQEPASRFLWPETIILMEAGIRPWPSWHPRASATPPNSVEEME